MTTKAQYLALVTTEHSQRPKFIAGLSAVIDGLAGAQATLEGLIRDFDVDTAVGVQLDIIGLWVGVSRRVDVPLADVYFTWDDTAQTGWDSSVWQGPFDPDSGLVELPDDSYRLLLKARIAANSWDGSIPGAYRVWREAFGDGSTIIIQDNQDMSMVIGVANTQLSTVSRALLVGGYIPIKPVGVRVRYYAIPVDDGPLFVWDVDNDALAGWDEGAWPLELTP